MVLQWCKLTHIVIFMPSREQLTTIGILFWAVHPYVPPSVRGHILKVRQHDVLQTVCGNFTKFTTSVQLGTKDELIRFWGQNLKGQRLGSQWDYIVNSALREEFLTYLWNAWTYFSETNHNYLLPGPHDIDNIFMVMDLKVKVTDNVFLKMHFRWRHTDYG